MNVQLVQLRCRKCRCMLLEDSTLVEEHNGNVEKPRDFVMKDYRNRGFNVFFVFLTRLSINIFFVGDGTKGMFTFIYKGIVMDGTIYKGRYRKCY